MLTAIVSDLPHPPQALTPSRCPLRNKEPGALRRPAFVFVRRDSRLVYPVGGSVST
jgi:hypothetical protein